jgi:hypothetical protein
LGEFFFVQYFHFPVGKIGYFLPFYIPVGNWVFLHFYFVENWVFFVFLHFCWELGILCISFRLGIPCIFTFRSGIGYSLYFYFPVGNWVFLVFLLSGWKLGIPCIFTFRLEIGYLVFLLSGRELRILCILFQWGFG